MDVRYFLEARTGFIRQLYGTTSAPYLERKRKIEAQEEPFVPPYSEDGDPPFLREWSEADESLQVLAYSCVSMLAASIHLYLKAFEHLLHKKIHKSLMPEFKKNWLRGYGVHFSQHLGIRFEDCPASLEVLEEVILARNRVQHPESIAPHRPHYSGSDLEKIASPLFVDERERNFLADVSEDESNWLMPPTLHITPQKLLAAIEQVDKFGEWFEKEFDSRVYGR
jgi:hypothetical protein